MTPTATPLHANRGRSRSCSLPIIYQKDVLRAQAGDETAYERLYRSHRESVFWLCLRVTRNVADAEDLTQQVFLQAFLKLRTFRRQCTFRTWISRIALNESLMHLRRRKHSEITVGGLSDLDFDSSAAPQRRNDSATVLKRILLWQLMKTIPEQTRLLLQMRHLAGWTQKELTDWLGVPLGTTKAQLSRARKALRRAFETLHNTNVNAIKKTAYHKTSSPPE